MSQQSFYYQQSSISGRKVTTNVRPEIRGADPDQQYCTLESSFSTVGCGNGGSPSTLSNHSASGVASSPQDYSSSPASVSYAVEEPYALKHKLMELEAALLGPDSDMPDSPCGYPSPGPGTRLMEVPSEGDLKQVLIACAEALSQNDMLLVDWLMGELKRMVSVSGDPLQRLGAYLFEGLVARMASSGSSIYKALRCKEPTSSDLLSYMRILYEACPLYKFGYMSANGAIAEAVKGEDRVHIIDFQIAMGGQWVTLIRALAARPCGPPFLRITGIDDSIAAYARGGGLHLVGDMLSRLAESCGVPFEFHAGAVCGTEVVLESLGVRPGGDEALVVNFAYQLHHMPDGGVGGTRNHRDQLLRMVKSLSPRVVTLVEQESDTNATPFVPRFVETLDYYTAIFESIDAALPRDSSDRIAAEQHCLARDIVNIVACEGEDRVERHELLGKWRSRFASAGFEPLPLSPLVNSAIEALLENYCEDYRLEERFGALYLGWKNRDLVVSCAWR